MRFVAGFLLGFEGGYQRLHRTDLFEKRPWAMRPNTFARKAPTTGRCFDAPYSGSSGRLPFAFVGVILAGVSAAVLLKSRGHAVARGVL